MDPYQAISSEFSESECISFLVALSSYHRIQGSSGLELASDYITKVLHEGGLNVKGHSYPYARDYGLLEAPVGWDVRSAELFMLKPEEKLLHNFVRSKTLVVTHSPRGEMEASVVNVGKGEGERDYEGKAVEGKLVIAYGGPYSVYKMASKKGAVGILLYKREGPEEAVPYLGLFLNEEEAKDAKAVALSISRKTAGEILSSLERGKDVVLKAKVDACYREKAEMKVVEAIIEGNSEEKLDLIAHYCHPGGTANDNASGSAGLMELALSMKRALNEGKLDKPVRSISFCWYPEYYGSIAFLLNEGRRAIAAINLDMIGERQELTGSTLMLIRAPHFATSYVEAVLHYELKKAFSTISPFSSPRKALSIRFSSIGYECGSDHDIYLDFGVPAFMVNQWPDRFYHSDQDTVDKVDPTALRMIAVAAGAAAYKSASIERYPELKGYVYHYFMSLLNEELGEALMSKTKDVYELRKIYLCESFSSAVQMISKELASLLRMEYVKSEVEAEEKRYVRNFKGPVQLRWLIRRFGEEKVAWLKELLEEKKYYHTVLMNALPMLLDKPISTTELINKLRAEFGGDISKDHIISMLNFLREVELISEVK